MKRAGRAADGNLLMKCESSSATVCMRRTAAMQHSVSYRKPLCPLHGRCDETCVNTMRDQGSLAMLDNERQHALQRLDDFGLGGGVEGAMGGGAGAKGRRQKAMYLAKMGGRAVTYRTKHIDFFPKPPPG